MESIFVQISAYHDYELSKTIIDCIEKSSKENLINIGIHLCYYEKDDILIPDLENVKYIKTKAPEGLGVGYGRYKANQFYDNEDYYLQIDAHTRFAKNWDKQLIENYKKYVDEGCNPVLTAYPSGYHYEDSVIKYDSDPFVVFADFVRDESTKKPDFLHQTSMANEPGNIFTRALSAGHIFSSGSIAKISPNYKMFNWGEEFLEAIRLFTHGYDLMLPEKQVLYHLYYGKEPENQRRLAGQDFSKENDKIFSDSQEEIRRILSDKIIGEQELGSKRKLEDFWYYADIDFS